MYDIKNIKETQLSDLVPDPINARIHNERNIEEIKKSLKAFGQHAPLVVQKETNKILVGNGRYQAMTELGWEKAVVWFVDDDNITALRRSLADNRVAELASWDEGILNDLLQNEELKAQDVVGWTSEERDDIFEKINGNISNRIDVSEKIKSSFEVIIVCADETDQQKTYEKLISEGKTCRISTL